LGTALPPLNKPTRIPNAISFPLLESLGSSKAVGEEEEKPYQ
jgi:hypothetical protein